MDTPRNPNSRAAAAVAQEFARSGVTDVCVSPGSRSTPLVTAILRENAFHPWVILDERSAGFFALGIARETRRPVVLICTSGTAAANYLPAVVEASLSRVAIIVITADRPPEARECRSAQTIDQVRIFGSHVKWSVDLATPYPGDALDDYYRTIACRAAALAATAPPGPVHLNVPMREPLIDVAEEAGALRQFGRDEQSDAVPPRVRVHPVRRMMDADAAQVFAARLRGFDRGMIVCGPRAARCSDEARAIAVLARRLRWPVIADPLSGLRFGAHDRTCVIDSYDVLLRDACLARSLRPDAIIQFGDPPVSKPLAQFMGDGIRRMHVMVAEEGTWPDPLYAATDVAPVGVSEFCAAVDKEMADSAPPSQWLESWARSATAVRAALNQMLADESAMFEGKVVSETIRLLPDGGLAIVGNSMPVRDLDTFAGSLTRDITLCANRGANGIDGVLSSALGAAAARTRPTVLILGDLSCLHDIGALQIAARYPIHLLAIVINNDGGGIFSFLPQAQLGAPFETYFATPHALDFESASALGRARYARIASWPDFQAQVSQAFEHPGMHLLEIRSERSRNLQSHRRMIEAAINCAHATGLSGSE